MCTLIVMDRIVPSRALIVASNRDEFFARPASPPTRVEPEGVDYPAFVAPQDLEAGGTWMGVNAHGLFVGLTNRRPRAELRKDARSRGLLVQDALRCASAAQVHERVAPRLEGLYNPCHLFYGDGKQAFLSVVSEDAVETTELAPGAHVICNRDADDPVSGKVIRIQGAIDAIDPAAPLGRVLDSLADVLRQHEQADPLENPCVHTDGYGTRSSMLLALGQERWQGWHAEGPPCEAKYRNCTRLLEGLRVSGRTQPKVDHDSRSPR